MADRVKKAHGHILQADWNQIDPLEMDYIHNKPDVSDVIKSSVQNLSEDQKAQTRTNIGAVAIEEFNNSWEDDAIFVFDKDTKKFKYSGKTLSGLQSEMKLYIAQFVAEYVENYLSLETIVYPDGTIVTDSDILYVNGTTTEINDEDGSTILYVEENNNE